MQRLIRLSLFIALLAVLSVGTALAQKPQIFVSGKLHKDSVRVFLKDNIYVFDKEYFVEGTVIVEPGTQLLFYPNGGRLVIAPGGRFIADGYAEASYTDANASQSRINTVVQTYAPLGFASANYFFSNNVYALDTEKEVTVNDDKRNHVFNVLLDWSGRNVRNITNPLDPNLPLDINQNYPGEDWTVVSHEQALLWYASRLQNDPEGFDPNLKTLPWKRLGGKSVAVSPAPIKFMGVPTTNFSQEWGHIIVLPGARAAFFRNCEFENMKKDTLVDRVDIFDTDDWGNQYNAVNDKLVQMQNGAGGAITTYSSRTWLLDVTFRNNTARVRGGALNILQAPVEYDFAWAGDINNLPKYPLNKNPHITDPDGTTSEILEQYRIPAIDYIDETMAEPLTDYERQAVDDGRLAVYLGRMRNMTFADNFVQLANTVRNQKGNPPVTVIEDDTTSAATYPMNYGNHAFGGAIYMEGSPDGNRRNIEVGFGVNHTMLIGGNIVDLYDGTTTKEIDEFRAIGNRVRNYQSDFDTEGSFGGAIYVGENTSLIASGEFANNRAYSKFFDDPGVAGENSGTYSLGGGIFIINSVNRLQLRGGPERVGINETRFTGNIAGAGGAIYVDGNAYPSPSPIVGGSDATLNTRDYGYDILFDNNYAITFGGAIFTRRNFTVYGSGGVEAGSILGYDGLYPVKFHNNNAGLSGGAIDVKIPRSTPPLPAWRKVNRLVRAEFVNNQVGAGVTGDLINYIRGGGAIHSLNGDLNLVKAVDFIGNKAYNSNGGAVAVVQPQTWTRKYFISDLDQEVEDANGVVIDYNPVNDIFTGKSDQHPADVRMLTRFIENEVIITDDELFARESGSGTTQIAQGIEDVVRRHRDSDLPENGIGLGGGLYILDEVDLSKVGRTDSVQFNRVRMQNNTSFTGSAIYSDNYDLKLIFNRSLITGNVAESQIGMEQNVIIGPVERSGDNIVANVASSDLAGATIYGEIQGPLPSHTFSEAANSIYNNNARFLIRLPDAPNTKGVLAGGIGAGFGGTDTLRGNYWGHTEANVRFVLPHLQQQGGQGLQFSQMETFFVMGDGQNWLPLDYNELLNDNPADPRKKGPFESVGRENDITYVPVTLNNGADQNTPGDLSIPEKLVFSGHVYDLYDKGIDVKTADYSERRMSPIEDFAVGIPPVIRRYDNPGAPSDGRYLIRWVRNPEDVEAVTEGGSLKYPELASLQTEWAPDTSGVYYHPIGYPLYLEAAVNYEGLTRRSNHDPLLLNESVFFVINLKTGDYIRTNLEQVGEDAPYREVFRSTVELVPDSSNRRDPSHRRTTEGLANLGSGPELLFNLFQNEYKEDAGTLPGRRWHAPHTLLGNRTDLYSNRPEMPASNNVGGTNWVSVYGGERYQALPVRVGDSVLVVSRTVLWRDGVDIAADQGIAFRISESSLPPLWTGDIVKLQTDTIKKLLPSDEDPNVKEEVVITEFLNKIFVTEDRAYPQQDGWFSTLEISDPNNPNMNAYGEELAGGQGRDSIMTATAIDPVQFYDPRSLLDEDNYARLGYDYNIDPNSGLARWLVVAKRPASFGTKDGAAGYLEFHGQPINPFIVPGGEEMSVYVENWPPHFRTLDALIRYYIDNGRTWDEANNRFEDDGLQDSVSKWIETYPTYLHAELYEFANARYLQQDTVNVSPKYSDEYKFKIFVVDSVPRFIEPDEETEEVRRAIDDELIVTYEPSVYTCGQTGDRRLKANLTDKLRFQIDINTDDELEDKSPLADGWDYRYGRTAYGFANKSIRYNPQDTAIIDSITVDDDRVLTQSRPIWLAGDYLYRYDSDTDADEFGTDFTTHGQLNIRIPAAEAFDMLRPGVESVGALNTDTTFIIVANDGHGGISSKLFDVIVNVQPRITNDQLPPATEGQDYNPTLLDSTRMVKVFDPNFDQGHTYQLIYASTQEDEILIDPCFPEAGVINLSDKKTTPEWLKINPVNGMLYGTPGVLDAPRTNAEVVVVVTDQDGLSTWKRFSLQVNEIDHGPDITSIQEVDCINPDGDFEYTINVTDEDLLRTDPAETVTITIVDENGDPIAGLEADPSQITGGQSEAKQTVVIRPTGQPLETDNGKLTFTVVVEDAFGNTAEQTYRLNVSLATAFTSVMRVANVSGSFQDLEWGTCTIADAVSTGDNNDGEGNGKLDEELCEYELPPKPFADVFDARWQVPERQGILRNIFPAEEQGVNGVYYYKAEFQSGGVDGDGSSLYPITLEWDITTIPAIDDATANPAGSSWYLRDRFSDGNLFRFDMRDPENENYVSSGVQFEMDGTTARVIITNNAIEGFVIVYDIASSVPETAVIGNTNEITKVTPNPTQNSTMITYTLKHSSDVTIQVVDNLGNVVRTIDNARMAAGTYNIEWDGLDDAGSKVASGVYNVQLISSGSRTSTYKVQVVK
jgi:predicted outer membrane repeat protein